MVALEEDGAGFVDFIVDLAARSAIADQVVMDLLAIHDDGDPVADHGGFHGLPFTCRFGHEFVRRLEVVNGTISRLAGLAIFVVAEDLEFVPPAQVEAAV